MRRLDDLLAGEDRRSHARRHNDPCAVRQTVSRTKVTFSPDGNNVQGADAILVVVGEPPYAEMKGDRTTCVCRRRMWRLVERARQAGAPVVTILLSGRPWCSARRLDASQAFVAAWLPGTEGQGVADVLFGAYKPTGRLPHTWPRTNEQATAAVGTPGAADPLFPYRFGLPVLARPRQRQTSA